MSCKVTEWHGVSQQMLFQTLVLGFLLVFNVLLNESSLVVVEVLEYKLLVKWVVLIANNQFLV